MAIITGLSGNELYCLKEKGYSPGNLVIGNSVFALGFAGGVVSGLKTLGGGEVHQITEIIRDGRSLAYLRMIEEARRHVGVGVTGVASQLIFHSANIEILVHRFRCTCGSRRPSKLRSPMVYFCEWSGAILSA
ncbi:MAG: heavy metal-binding domain-containing protein [Candidatus Obscuribacterales bacterium]